MCRNSATYLITIEIKRKRKGGSAPQKNSRNESLRSGVPEIVGDEVTRLISNPGFSQSLLTSSPTNKSAHTAICGTGALQSLGPAAPTTLASTLYTTPGVRPVNELLAAVVCADCNTTLGAAAVLMRQL